MASKELMQPSWAHGTRSLLAKRGRAAVFNLGGPEASSQESFRPDPRPQLVPWAEQRSESGPTWDVLRSDSGGPPFPSTPLPPPSSPPLKSSYCCEAGAVQQFHPKQRYRWIIEAAWRPCQRNSSRFSRRFRSVFRRGLKRPKKPTPPGSR